MSLEEVAGATYGPYPMRIARQKVAEYLAVTGDESVRWAEHAPPSFAGALLFVVAPHFLDDPRVRPFTGVLVHVDQTFTWHGPLPIDAAISITGRVDKIRERGGRYFVTFSAAVETAGGDRLLDAVATFLMGEGTPPEGGDDPGEPAVGQRGRNEQPSLRPRPGIGEPLIPISKSASRVDLVKYAAASGDYNPVHFDHEAARHSGLEGIVVHGLLMSAWAMQIAAGISARPDPLAHIKIRFRNPLSPAAQAQVSGVIREIAADESDCQVTLEVASGDDKLVTAGCVVRLDG